MKYLILTLPLCALLAQTPASLPAKPQPPQIPPDTVVLKVGDKTMTAAEVNQLVSTFAQDIQTQAARDPKSVFTSYFLMRSLADQAAKDKLDQTSPVKEQLELQRAQTLAGALINRHGASIAVSDEDVKKRFDADKAEKYQQARIRVIFFKCATAGTVTTGIDMADPSNPKKDKAPILPTENEARLKADDTIKKAKGGADFAALAKDLSDDKQSGPNGGLLPPVRQSDRIPDELKKVVFSMKPGDISEPVKQTLGFYVIKMEERGLMPFEDAKTAVATEIRQERFQKWMEEVRKPFEVSIESPEFFGFKGPSPAAPATPTAKPAK